MNILGTIWFKPREAMREVINGRSFLLPLLILFLGSIGFTLMNIFNTGEDLEGISLLVPTLIAAPIIYFVTALFFALALTLLGKWLFKGIGTFKDLIKVVSTSYLPFIIATPVFGIWLIFSTDSFLHANQIGIMGLIVMFCFSTFISIYSFIFNLVGVSEAHQISKWKAFFTMLIPGIIMFVLLVIFIIFIGVIFIFLLGASS